MQDRKSISKIFVCLFVENTLPSNSRKGWQGESFFSLSSERVCPIEPCYDGKDDSP